MAKSKRKQKRRRRPKMATLYQIHQVESRLDRLEASTRILVDIAELLRKIAR